MSGIYIHVPFCRKACAYCDFHFSTDLKYRSSMVEAIVKEILDRKDEVSGTLESIYFGGGTPSVLENNKLMLILQTIQNSFEVANDAEITLEANPDDCDMETLARWKSAGINRLSLGFQSFNDQELSWMNRSHNAAQSVESIKTAREAGFNNITIDLIYGSKFQSLDSWKETLNRAIALQPNHISAYNLTIEDKTLLGVKNRKRLEPDVDDELSSTLFLTMSEVLESNGYLHYEISNFAQPGSIAVHNSNYWKGKNYLGVGPSAHSFNGVSRRWNVSNNQIYMNKVLKDESDYFETETLSLANRFNEYIYTGLRTIWGISLKEVEDRFGAKAKDHLLSGLSSWKNEFEHEDGRYFLNKKGRLFTDRICSDLFMETD